MPISTEDVGALGFFLYRCGPGDYWHKHDLGLCATLEEAEERASDWERGLMWKNPVTDRRIALLRFTQILEFDG